jgi:MFS family permease
LILSQANDEPWQVLLASALLGGGVGAAFAAMVALIAENVDPREMGVATGMNTVVRLVGATVGGQIGAALLTSQTIIGTTAPAESAFAWAFGLSAVAAAIAAGIALAIRKQPLRPAAAGP